MRATKAHTGLPLSPVQLSLDGVYILTNIETFAIFSLGLVAILYTLVYWV